MVNFESFCKIKDYRLDFLFQLFKAKSANINSLDFPGAFKEFIKAFLHFCLKFKPFVSLLTIVGPCG